MGSSFPELKLGNNHDLTMFPLINVLRTYTETSPSQYKSSEFCRSRVNKYKKEINLQNSWKTTRALSSVLFSSEFSSELLELRLKFVDNPHGFCFLSNIKRNFNVLQNNPFSQNYLSPIPLRDYLFQKSGRTIWRESLFSLHLYYSTL